MPRTWRTWAEIRLRRPVMSGMGLTLGFTRDNEIGQDGVVLLQSPAEVPEVAAGYWWSPSSAVGLGSAAFVLPEGNGHATFALLPTSATSFPTTLTENGSTQCRMRNAANAFPSVIATAGAVAAGWTGPTYVAGWFRWPSGVTSAANNLFTHTPSTAGQRRVVMTTATVAATVIVSADGTAMVNNTYPSPVLDSAWHWVEILITPGVSVDIAKDLVTVAHSTTVVPGATLFDGSSKLGPACRVAATLANVDTTDFGGVIVYAPGIPSLGNRIALSRYRAPV